MMRQFAIPAAKLARRLSQLSGRGQGEALPGLVAEKFDPGLATRLADQLPHGVIIVTGTNGKTTTTKLIYDILTASGERVLSNRTGSNLKRGVVSALIAGSDRRGRLKGDPTIGLFELDEANLRLVTRLVKPRAIVVTNLFRDQLDRYGELDTTAAKIGAGIEGLDTELYLNADDPLVASLARYGAPGQVHFFGIEGLPTAMVQAAATAIDSDHCPVCGDSLAFRRIFYGHIGHYRCKRGHFDRPQPAVVVTSVAAADRDGSTFTVAVDGKRYEATLPLGGVYNLYNALAALAVTHGSGVAVGAALESLGAAGAAFGRVERVAWDGREFYLLLVKNPAGFTQVLETFLRGEREARVLMVVNDLAADGRDVSWLWDVPFEALSKLNLHVTVSGLRAADMALRLKYAGIEASIEPDIGAALLELRQQTPPGTTAFVLPTYTAMLEVRKFLARHTDIVEAGL